MKVCEWITRHTEIFAGFNGGTSVVGGITFHFPKWFSGWFDRLRRNFHNGDGNLLPWFRDLDVTWRIISHSCVYLTSFTFQPRVVLFSRAVSLLPGNPRYSGMRGWFCKYQQRRWDNEDNFSIKCNRELNT